MNIIFYQSSEFNSRIHSIDRLQNSVCTWGEGGRGRGREGGGGGRKFPHIFLLRTTLYIVYIFSGSSDEGPLLETSNLFLSPR